MENPRIYVASLSDYNNGRLEGKWFDFNDYSDASELMGAIHDMLAEITKKYNDGEEREEWAVHDYEYIPSTLATEYMGEQDFQTIYDIIEASEEYGIPTEVLMERVGDTGSDDYGNIAESLMLVVDGNDESDIVYEIEEQFGELGFDFWQNHIYIDDVTQRVMYSEDVDRYREDIQSDNPDMDENEVERLAEQQADDEENRRNDDLIGYLEEMGYTDIPTWVSKDYESAWQNALAYDYDIISYDGKMYVFSVNYGFGGGVLVGGLLGAYIGYRIGEKKGFKKEKDLLNKTKRGAKKLGKKLTKGIKYDGGGIINGKYLDSLSETSKNKILQNIANHYGISLSEAEEEVRDEDAEMLYEYIANNPTLRMDVYTAIRNKRYDNGGNVKRLSDEDVARIQQAVAESRQKNQINPSEAFEFVKENPHILKLLMLKKGGKIDSENYEMLRGKIKEVEHHAKELKSITNRKKQVPAWVLAKSTRASTDMSDITHYMDSAKFDKGGNISYKEQQINEVNSWDNDEIANYLDVSVSAVAKDRNRYVREAQSVMMLSSYGGGGGVDNKKRFDVDFYDSSDTDRATYLEIIIRENTLEDAIQNAIKKAYKINKNYIEFYHRGMFLGSVDFSKSKDFRKGRFYDDFIKNRYSEGGGVGQIKVGDDVYVFETEIGKGVLTKKGKVKSIGEQTARVVIDGKESGYLLNNISKEAKTFPYLDMELGKYTKGGGVGDKIDLLKDELEKLGIYVEKSLDIEKIPYLRIFPTNDSHVIENFFFINKQGKYEMGNHYYFGESEKAYVFDNRKQIVDFVKSEKFETIKERELKEQKRQSEKEEWLSPLQRLKKNRYVNGGGVDGGIANENLIVYFESGKGESFIYRITKLNGEELYASWLGSSATKEIIELKYKLESKYSKFIFNNDHSDSMYYGVIVINDGKVEEYNTNTDKWLNKKRDLGLEKFVNGGGVNDELPYPYQMQWAKLLNDFGKDKVMQMFPSGANGYYTSRTKGNYSDDAIRQSLKSMFNQGDNVDGLSDLIKG